MAPKRKAPAQRAAPKAPALKPRLTKLAKQNGISNEQEAEISEAFNLFAVFGVEGFEKEKAHGVLEVENATRVLTALGISVSAEDQEETLETLDPADDGYVTYEPFLAYAALQLNALAEDSDDERRAEEIQASYAMFTHNGAGPITVAHLRRVAKTIREDVDDNTLKEMAAEANGKGKDGWRAGVTLEEFEGVLKRAGVLG